MARASDGDDGDGDEVVILWTGKEDLAGGRTLNTFKVALKKAPAPALPA